MRLSSLTFSLLIATCFLCLVGRSVFAFDKASDQVELKRCWSYSEEKVFTAITIDDSMAYVATNEAQIVAISLLTGQKVWSAELGGTLVSNLETSSIGLHLVTQPAPVDGKQSSTLLWRLSKETGIPAKPAESSEGKLSIKAVNGRLISVSASGKVSSIDPNTLVTVWNRVPTGSVTGEPFISTELIAFATGDGKLIKMSTVTGEIISTQQLASLPKNVFATRSGVVYGNERGELVSVDPNWKFRTGASVNSVTALGDALLATSFDNFIYYIRPGGGDVIWKKRLEGRIAGTVAVDGSRIAAFSLGAENGYLIDTKKGRTLGIASLGVQADAIVVGQQNPLGPVLLVNGSVVGFSSNGCKINGGAVVTTPPNSKQ